MNRGREKRKGFLRKPLESTENDLREMTERLTTKRFRKAEHVDEDEVNRRRLQRRIDEGLLGKEEPPLKNEERGSNEGVGSSGFEFWRERGNL